MVFLDVTEWLSDGIVGCSVLAALAMLGWASAGRTLRPALRPVPVPVQRS
ncbi:hypothetical protein [Methylobacterium sp. A54F]